jgi:hypothetical protein
MICNFHFEKESNEGVLSGKFDLPCFPYADELEGTEVRLLETRFYAAYGVPAFAYGPGLLTVSHTPNEFVPIRNIFQCALIYALTAAEMLR